MLAIDPDNFKQMLPEWGTYVQQDALHAGQHTHMESGYLVEIAQECVR